MELCNEVNKHKWYESEKSGKDIGFTQALINWTIKFKSQWVKSRQKNLTHKLA